MVDMAHAICRPEFPASLPCKIAFVGEAPAEREMIDGLPLKGASGICFDQIMRTANLRREDYLITNVFNIQAPDNDPINWTASLTEARERGWDTPDNRPYQGRYFEPAFAAGHLARLRDELERVRPAVVACLGGTALWALTGDSGISAARGALCRGDRLLPGVKVMPTFHPAYVIRQWNMFHVVAADLMKAAAAADAGPDLGFAERSIWIEPSLADIVTFRKRYLDAADVVTIDIETANKFRQITCVGFSADATHALSIPFVDFRKPNRSYWNFPQNEVEAWRHVEELCGSDKPKLLQNGPYDVFWLWDVMGIRVRNYCEDTRLLHHALYPELPKSLQFMGSCYAQQGAWKQMRNVKGDKRDD